MKAAPFDYTRAASLDQALAALAEGGDDAMVIAGGQTLVPMMAMRLARPAILVDVNDVAELQGIEAADGSLIVHACTRQSAAMASPDLARAVPLLAKAMPFIGHQQTRNRGTVGGSIAHGDPAAEIPLIAVALEAQIGLKSIDGERQAAAGDFFEGPMMTARTAGECLTEVEFPVWSEERVGTGFEEVAERHGDFAIVAAAAQVALDDAGNCRRAAVAVGGAGGTPAKLTAVEAALTGSALDAATVEAAAAETDGAIDPYDDSHASSDYRRRVARHLVARAVLRAATEARGTTA